MKSSVNQNVKSLPWRNCFSTVPFLFLLFLFIILDLFLIHSTTPYQKCQQPLKLFICIDFVSFFLFFNLCQGFNNFTTNVSSRFLISLSISGFQQIMQCLTY